MISVSDSLLSLGSPPLVRVKSCTTDTLSSSFGITPARAGKIAEAIALLAFERDHPRSCG